MNCICCERPVTYNEIGLTKRLLGRDSTRFYCRTCLAKLLGVSEKRLEEKQREYLAAGCTLFVAET